MTGCGRSHRCRPLTAGAARSTLAVGKRRTEVGAARSPWPRLKRCPDRYRDGNRRGQARTSAVECGKHITDFDRVRPHADGGGRTSTTCKPCIGGSNPPPGTTPLLHPSRRRYLPTRPPASSRNTTPSTAVSLRCGRAQTARSTTCSPTNSEAPAPSSIRRPISCSRVQVRSTPSSPRRNAALAVSWARVAAAIGV